MVDYRCRGDRRVTCSNEGKSGMKDLHLSVRTSYAWSSIHTPTCTRPLPSGIAEDVGTTRVWGGGTFGGECFWQADANTIKRMIFLLGYEVN